MAQPFSYMLNVPNPAEAVTGGLQQGVRLASMMERADLMAAQRRQTDIENRGLLAKQARATEFQNELGKLSSEGFSARGLNELMIKYPEASEQLKAQYASLSTQEKQSRIDTLSPIVAAVNAGDNASAQIEIRRTIDAFKNSGKTQEADAAQRMSELLFQNPAAARTIMNTSIAAAMGPDKYAEVFGKLEDQRRDQEIQPAKVAKAIAEGKIAEVKAQYQEQVEKAEIALKGAQTTQAKASAGASYASSKKTLAEIKRMEEMTPAERDKLVAETERLRAQTSKTQAEADRLSGAGAGTAAAESAARVREVANRIIQEPGALAGIVGPRWGLMPKSMMSDKQANIASDIEFLKSQQFLSQVQSMRGLGQLSDKEGAKLENAIASLDRQQSPDRLSANIGLIAKTIETAALRASKQKGGGGQAAEAPARPATITLPNGFTYTPEGE
jgi:hypothetical protein